MNAKSLKKVKEEQNSQFQDIAGILTAMSSPVRLKIIYFLSQSPHSVEQLSIKIDQSLANTSMHLKKMQRENLLLMKIDKQKRVYSLAHDQVKDFWENIQDLCKSLHPETKDPAQVIYPNQKIWSTGLEQTIKIIKNKKVVLLDVRPDDEVTEKNDFYQKYVQHIPFTELENRLNELKKNMPILVICRGRLCALSGESTDFLSKIGHDVYRTNFSWHQILKKIDAEDI